MRCYERRCSWRWGRPAGSCSRVADAGPGNLGCRCRCCRRRSPPPHTHLWGPPGGSGSPSAPQGKPRHGAVVEQSPFSPPNPAVGPSAQRRCPGRQARWHAGVPRVLFSLRSSGPRSAPPCIIPAPRARGGAGAEHCKGLHGVATASVQGAGPPGGPPAGAKIGTGGGGPAWCCRGSGAGGCSAAVTVVAPRRDTEERAETARSRGGLLPTFPLNKPRGRRFSGQR